MKVRRKIADCVYRNFPFLSSCFAAIYGYCRPPKKSYSLYGEDLILSDLFNGDVGGIYVDIGAFHSRWISNTYLLDKLGWYGFAVDVHKDKLLSFKMRRRCLTHVGAVVPKGFFDEEVTLYKFRRMSSEFDTINRETALDYAMRYNMKFDEYIVPAIPVDLLLEKASTQFRGNVKYLNIDIEGADEDILLSINPADFGVEVVQFENNTIFGGTPKVRAHLECCKYTRTASLGGTHTYVANSLVEKRFHCLNP